MGTSEALREPVKRFGADDVAALAGPEFSLVRHHHDTHRTPGGAPQRFVYALLRRNS